ncbi:hypothetical protein [Amycolatopsis sacchari]|uniref:hypothetical protein n=1 Tax=Amycolatopsis sacchari TaxID=115433 RepID=UPI003EBC77B1
MSSTITPRPSGTWAMPSRTRSSGARRVMSRPPNTTLPARRGRRPLITRRSVVLPAPLTPSTAVIDPRSTCKSTPCSARTGP